MITPKLVSIAEAAKITATSRSMIYRLMNAKKLKSVHIGGRHMIPVAALDALIAGEIS